MPSIRSGLLLLLAGLFTTMPSNTAQAQNGESYSPALFQDLQYRMVGPTRGGRVTAVAGHADQPSTFYMGATGGGVWKTADYGQSWQNLSDGYFQTASIGSIRVADSDPNVIYVGTGSDGIRSNVITGRGMYKSSDGGETWVLVGLENTGQIGAVLIHPSNPNLVYAAALGHPFGPNPERGVYRSKDGGTTWEHVFFISDSTGAVDLEFAPDNPDEIYVSMWRGERKPWTIISGDESESGVYKSTDGGDTWTRLEGGLPNGLVGKSDLAVSAADPDRLYVLIEAEPGGALYRSNDRGMTFEVASTQRNLLDRPFYYTNLDADPSDADVVYVNSTGYYKSTDGGSSFQRRSTPHGDNHDMWINPYDPDLFIQSNDGGANVTRDGGDTWSTQDNQPTAELYQVHVDDRFPYWLYAGQQDNSTIMVPSKRPEETVQTGPSAYWRSIGGCETGPAVPKPGDPNIVYSNCKGRFGRFNHLTGQEKQYYVTAANMYGHNPADLIDRFQRVSPIAVSPHNPNVVYHASQFLYKTTDEGVTWEKISPDLTAFEAHGQVISGSPITRDITGEEFYSTIYAIQESALEPGVIWVGANDGPVHVTRDGGNTWTDVTPPDLPSGGRVQTVESSPHQPGKAYFATYRYLLDDWEPYIYKTTDYGQTWSRLTTGENGIPADFPTRVIREDPDRAGLLYAGTEFGMFVSFDDGITWQPFQQNLPVTPITDIKVHHQDLVLSTMGRSFWIMDDLTPLHDLSDAIASGGNHVIEPKAAYRMPGGRGRFGFGAQSPTAPQYGQTGLVLDYYLVGNASDVELEILDTEGNALRRFSSKAPGRQTAMTQDMRAPEMIAIGTPRLPAEAGHNRFVWDLRHHGAWSSNARGGGRGGPAAVPGNYEARLTVGSWTETVPFEILMDPRVEADGVTLADLQEQLEINVEIRDLMSRARMAQAQLEEAQDALGDGDSPRHRALAEIDAALNDDTSIRYQQPMLVSQISYLQGMVGRADQKPGRDAYVRLEQLRSALEEVESKLAEVMETGGNGSR